MKNAVREKEAGVVSQRDQMGAETHSKTNLSYLPFNKSIKMIEIMKRVIVIVVLLLVFIPIRCFRVLNNCKGEKLWKTNKRKFQLH